MRHIALRMADSCLRGLPAFPAAFLIVGLAVGDAQELGLLFLIAAFLTLSSTAWRATLARRLKQDEQTVMESWFKRFGLSLLISAGGWGLAAASVFDTSQLGWPSLLAMAITIALLAQVGSMNAALLWLVNSYLVVMAAPLMVVLASSPSPGWFGAVGGVIYLGYASLHARSLHRSIWRSGVDAKLLEVRHQELESTQLSLRQAHDSLEQEVQERTADYERVEADLRQREWDYRQIFEAVHDAIMIFRPEGEVILSVNRRACEIYGFEREELVGRSIMSFSLNPAQGKRRVIETLTGGATLAFRTRQRHRDGREMVLDINATAIEYRGEPAILSINRDVTEELRNEELRLAKEAAERANRAKSGFLANMSHEIRTPMAGVIGLSDLMLKTELSGRQQGYAETIRSSALSLLEVIDDILDFSKIEAGKLTLERSIIDLRELIERIVELLQPRAAAKGIELRAVIDDRLPPHLFAPPARLRQVLLNLASNAVKFTEDGEVELDVELLSQDFELACLRFCVRDTGIGMDPSMVPRLFTPFTQADASTSRRFGGSGLGLAISRQLVKLMGGDIEVESAEGSGSTFSFELTFEIAEAKDDTTTGSRFVSRPDARILVAEDNPVNQLVILEQLGDLGYRAEAVANGEEALRAIESDHYDLVLMDCQMPGLDGYEATRRLRAQEEGHLPVIALTAHAMKGDRERCLDAGMDDYISKPFTEARLEKTLRRWLDARP